MSEHVFAIKGDTIRALWSDEIADDLRALGRLTVERASRVEFDNAFGGWTVQLADGRYLAQCVQCVLTDLERCTLPYDRLHAVRFQSRQDALDAERAFIEEYRL